MTSPFADSAALYRENGLSVIPCAAGAKFPGSYSAAHGWRAAYDWQKYCDRMPTGYEVQAWDRWPDAGICAPLGPASGANGMHLVAVDIDTDVPEEVAAIRSVLPGSPCAKRGAKGETQFYLAPPSVVSRPYNDADKRRMLDLLCAGRQTVLPPSAHPALGTPYVWITLDTLETFDVEDLPVLPADIADRLGKALAPFGYQAPELRMAEAGDAALNGESIHRSLNDAALANLHAWVPGLQLVNCRRVGDKYKATSHWRPSSTGRPMSKRAANLAISSDGIKDCGDSKGYTPLDLVMAACGSDLDTAFTWLQERVAPAKPIILTARPAPEPTPQDTPQPAPQRKRGNLSGLVLATVDGAHVDFTAQADPETGEIGAPLRADGTVIPAELCTPAGLVGEIVEWMNACSPVPAPQLNLAAAISLLGTLYGRRYETPTGARSNLYAIGVAESGFGKSYPLKCCNAIDAAAKLERFFGPGGIKSDSALRKLLEKKNPVFVMMDEIGEMLGNILDRRAAPHHVGLRELLLALFSAADDVYRGSEGAAEAATAIYNPHLCLLGMSTPSAFWSAFSSANAENGLLPRMLIFDAGTDEPEEVEPKADRRDVPASIVKAIHATLDVKPQGNLAGVLANGPVTAMRAAWAPGAAETYNALRDEMKRKRRMADGLEKLAYSRFAEHVIKLALIHAVGCDPRAPMISVASLTWARAVIEYTTRAFIVGAKDRVADNDNQRDYKEVRRFVREAGAWGISEKDLVARVNGKIDRRRFDDILGQLKRAGEVEGYLGSGPRGGRPAPRLRVPEEYAEVG